MCKIQMTQKKNMSYKNWGKGVNLPLFKKIRDRLPVKSSVNCEN